MKDIPDLDRLDWLLIAAIAAAVVTLIGLAVDVLSGIGGGSYP